MLRQEQQSTQDEKEDNPRITAPKRCSLIFLQQLYVKHILKIVFAKSEC